MNRRRARRRTDRRPGARRIDGSGRSSADATDDHLPRESAATRTAGASRAGCVVVAPALRDAAAGARRRDRHARPLPVLRPADPVVGGAHAACRRGRRAPERASSIPRARDRAERRSARWPSSKPARDRRRRRDRRACLRRPRLRASARHATGAARRRIARDVQDRRALHRPPRRRDRRRRLRLRADRRALGKNRAARRGCGSATMSRSAPTPASTAARSATP